MDDAALDTIREQLNRELSQKDANIGIAFGIELYKAFGIRGWLTEETFSVQGTGAFPIQVFAYDRSHNATAWWDMEEWEYKVGTRNP